MDNFICSKCGACCRNLDKSIYFAEYDMGNGVCRYFDEETNLCTIYDDRPLLCNIEKAYDAYFKEYMTLDEYYSANYESCETLRALNN